MSNLLTNYVTSGFFPNQLSASDVEILVRSPYSFYAKKILGLKKPLSLASKPALAEFGNFIHQVIDQYSKTYQPNLVSRRQYLLDISLQLLAAGILPGSTQKIWHTKFTAIIEEFIEFDQKRRQLNRVYSELGGEMRLSIAGQKIKITAIADRIEIDPQGNVVIIDYKTGTLPSKHEIETGFSPQLIIEALICLAGGFGIDAKNISSLIYVKIASSAPYIQTFEIQLTPKYLALHRQGFESLLEYYVVNKQFSLNIDLLKYNDYRHLARWL